MEPLDKRNREAIGYDMFSEPIRRKAMETARDTGRTALTKKVTLVQEIDEDVQAGMLMYRPLYKKGAPVSTVEQRRKALLGFVYAPFRMNDFMKHIDFKRSVFDMKVYDSNDTSEQHLLYSSFNRYSEHSRYTAVKTVKVNNLQWQIHFASTVEFDTTTRSPYPLVLTLVGLIANFILLLIILTLVNSLNKLKEQTKKSHEQTSYMLHQSRMAQMGEMISMIAHQWRQPLASISTISGTLSIDVVTDNYKKEFFTEQLEAIDQLSNHLSSTINDFRSFFKKNKQKEIITVDALVQGTLQIIGSSFESKNVDLICQRHDNIELYTDVNEVKQVILNIFKNAEDALLDKKVYDMKIWVSWERKGDMVEISIEDNAGGIPNKILKDIFNPYFTTKQHKDGTGLGLYMSKTIVEEHCGGEINVKNTQNGARFTISLPSSLPSSRLS
ncbi:MAG: CHASE domain-containing protein [Sulfurimonas sp.]